MKQQGEIKDATAYIRSRASLSERANLALRYTLASLEALAGNVEEAKRLIAEEIAAKPEAREKALKDDDLKAIHEFVRLSQTP
jgi:Flp pilus assembly protein TadD